MSAKHTLGTLVIAFFETYLGAEQDLAGNTIASYSTCVKLLIPFCCDRLKKKIDALAMEDIDAQLILQFLDYLEDQRENLPQTRNTRLAAIHTFFRFLALQDPTMIETCNRICAIKPKKTPHRIQPSLTCQQVDAFLSVVQRESLWGLRDHALLLFLHNTGARVSEVANLQVGDLRLEAPFHVSLIGKGNKQRIIPIWKETAQAIRRYLDLRNRDYDQQIVFLNTKGRPISRFGIGHIVTKYHLLAQQKCPSLKEVNVTPHTFRHTAALHFIQSNVDIATVKDWLGHADINTTQLYFSISLEMKEKALQARQLPQIASVLESETPRWQDTSVLEYLDNLASQANSNASYSPKPSANPCWRHPNPA